MFSIFVSPSPPFCIELLIILSPTDLYYPSSGSLSLPHRFQDILQRFPQVDIPQYFFSFPFSVTWLFGGHVVSGSFAAGGDWVNKFWPTGCSIFWKLSLPGSAHPFPPFCGLKRPCHIWDPEVRISPSGARRQQEPRPSTFKAQAGLNHLPRLLPGKWTQVLFNKIQTSWPTWVSFYC